MFRFEKENDTLEERLVSVRQGSSIRARPSGELLLGPFLLQ